MTLLTPLDAAARRLIRGILSTTQFPTEDFRLARTKPGPDPEFELQAWLATPSSLGDSNWASPITSPSSSRASSPVSLSRRVQPHASLSTHEHSDDDDHEGSIAQSRDLSAELQHSRPSRPIRRIGTASRTSSTTHSRSSSQSTLLGSGDEAVQSQHILKRRRESENRWRGYWD
ncbi:hypothetical protein BX600DRAFT_442654 [Xylariales sp. PMI_506]|nr:hypothetical protein BX600DRAFT_442654 [Xylariales sp. PMI_506]